METQVSDKTDSFFEQLAVMNNITVEDVRFVDQSFREHGWLESPAFGDYSVGLEKLGEEAGINIHEETRSFRVELVGKHWDFVVHVDRSTGEWEEPMQGEIAPEPEFD